jgi:hypothetical protein
MSTNANINSMMENIERILEAAQATVENMVAGERIQIKELAKKVASAVALDPKRVLGYVNDFAHQTDIAYVTRGKNGGLIRGTRPAKVIKKAKKVITPAADSSDSTQ